MCSLERHLLGGKRKAARDDFAADTNAAVLSVCE